MLVWLFRQDAMHVALLQCATFHRHGSRAHPCSLVSAICLGRWGAPIAPPVVVCSRCRQCTAAATLVACVHGAWWQIGVNQVSALPPCQVACGRMQGFGVGKKVGDAAAAPRPMPGHWCPITAQGAWADRCGVVRRGDRQGLSSFQISLCARPGSCAALSLHCMRVLCSGGAWTRRHA